MWSRGITTIALCVICVSGALAALPPPSGPTPAASAQAGLMRALELAPAAVAAWKRQHDGDNRSHEAPVRHPSRKRASKGQVKSPFDPFGINVFAGS